MGCWFSNPCVYFQKQLLQLRQKYLFVKFFFKIYWLPYFLKLCCARVFPPRWNSFVCKYIQSRVSSFVFPFLSLLPLWCNIGDVNNTWSQSSLWEMRDLDVWYVKMISTWTIRCVTPNNPAKFATISNTTNHLKRTRSQIQTA